MLMFANDLAQAPAQPIPRDRAADPARGNKAGTKTASFVGSEHTQSQQFAAMRLALVFDLLKFRRAGEPLRFRESEALHRHVELSNISRLPALVRYSKSLPAGSCEKTLQTDQFEVTDSAKKL